MYLGRGRAESSPLDEKLRTVYDRKTNAYQIFTYWRLLMSVIPKITCRRCGRSIPVCAAAVHIAARAAADPRERIPLRTSSENAGTPAAEHAAVNTKWQMLFGGIFAHRGRRGRHRAHHREPERQQKYFGFCGADPPATVSSAAPVTTPTPDAGATPTPTPTPSVTSLTIHVPRQQAHGVCGQGSAMRCR